jgi:ParB-like chromosome segregation protein Spo0J
MSARTTNQNLVAINTPVRSVAPVTLSVHPILLNHPQWDDESPEFDAFCRDIAEFGIDHALLIDSKNRIVDGRQRWRAAMRLKIDSVQVQTVPDEAIPRLILHCILARRHYSRGALTYMSLTFIEECYAANGKSIDQIVQHEFGFSLSTFKQARQVRDIFREGDLGEEFRQRVEPELLAGEMSLGDILAGWGGFRTTRKVKKKVRSALDLWDRSFSDLQRRFSTWDKFDPETKATVAARLTPLVESMPVDLMQKLRAKLDAELKQRKENGK